MEVIQDFQARPYQQRFMGYLDHHGLGGRAVWVVHRRGGKDLTALHQTVKMMLGRRGVYWHVFPTAEQGRKAIWEGFTSDGKRIMESVFPEAIRKSPRGFLPNAEMIVELKCGSLWRLIGSDRMEVVGAGPVGVVFSEFALAKPNTWDLVRPMLRENGGWAAFITTPRGNNHAKRLFDVAGREPGWFRDLKTLYDTRAYDPEATIEGERAEGMPEALIRQEYLCDWTAALVGSVYGDLLESAEKAGAIGDFSGDNSEPVYTSWDLGGAGNKGDATAIWWWRPSREGADFLDYYECTGKPLSHYLDKLEEKAKEHGFIYQTHWVPHDSRAKTLVTGVSVLDQFLEDPRIGRKRVDVVPGMSFADGIQAARWLLQRKVRFHSRCAEGIEALKAYHYDWDEERKSLSGAPVHDWSSHGSDAFRYASLVVRGSEEAHRKEEPKRAPVARSPDSFTLEEIWDTGPKSSGRRI